MLSILVGVVASYAALDLARRVGAATGLAARLWGLGGAAVMGAGIWAMHFIGMLAFVLPIRMAYDLGLTLLSLLVAIAASGTALMVAGSARAGPWMLRGGGLMMGVGICAMHYIGMAAMRMSPPIQYDPMRVALSLLIAIGAAYAALWLAFALRNMASEQQLTNRLLGAVVMGFAISGMHYTGMAAADFAPGAYCAVPGEHEIDNQLLGYGIGILMLCLLAVVLLISSLESRIAQRTGRTLHMLRKSNHLLRREMRARERLQRMYAVLSATTTLIMQSRTRDALLQGSCRIATDTGGFALAWIGLLRDGSVRPDAVAGRVQATLPTLRFSMAADGPNHDGPTARALRSGQPVVCNDVRNEAGLSAWQDWFAEHDLHAYAALPLVVAGQVQGCMGLFAATRDSIGDDELKLLVDMVGNLSHALAALSRDARLSFLSEHDSLTGLPNRNHFRRHLDERLARDPGRPPPAALVVMDLRLFNRVNAALGRTGGDQLLREVARRLTALVDNDASRISRDAADRFLLTVDKAPDEEALTLFTNSFDIALDNPLRIGHQDIHIDFRLGIARYPADGDTADALIHCAETALQAARQRQERAVLHTPALAQASGVQNQIIQLLPEALNRGELRLHYQPKMDCGTGAVCGAEALLRWQHPSLGMVPPSAFVTVLEDSGQIVPVGAWAMTQALRDHNRWRVEGLASPRVAVNVSAVQLRQARFVDDVRNAIAYLPPELHGLDIEVTESVVMSDPEGAASKLRALQAMGMSIAIDDFGTGYSSLAKLTRLPVNALKIDRSFIVDLDRSGKAADMVAAIIGLAHGLGLKVIAEGVETPEQLTLLRQLNCDQIQGFLFSPGLPADDFSALLASGRLLPVG
ncbi:EAL domain-containing protein [Flagellatimonas centrodinii]|uniref:EAL domain-containing protein n=1 Tax=Flagellatimonas centrodinii TaxID=2806210 RepID=UPI001FED60C4|nr:EAL domain-containing protein [Flagellatimonas centrodinii]ULQ46740.1 EAL domain-containing protein [Flagellatimonas centrodinii]